MSCLHPCRISRLGPTLYFVAREVMTFDVSFLQTLFFLLDWIDRARFTSAEIVNYGLVDYSCQYSAIVR